jgi:uncharacterized membrane protein YbhN (UPF0104 family)
MARVNLVAGWRLSVFSGVTVLLVGQFLMYARRVHIVLEQCGGRPVPYLSWLRLFAEGNLLNYLVPQAGNVYRSVRLKADHRIRHTHYVSAQLSFAWIDTVASFLMAGITVALFDPATRVAQVRLPVLLLGVAAMGAILPPLLGRLARGVPVQRIGLGQMKEPLIEMLRTADRTLKSWRILLTVTALGVVAFGNTAVIYWLLFRGLGRNVGVGALAAFSTLNKVSGYIVVTPGGNLGLRELAFGILASQAAIAVTDGILVSAMVRGFSILALASLWVCLKASRC